MTRDAKHGGGRRGNRIRVAAWSAAGLVLLAPLVAMQFSDEAIWSASDFAFAAALMIGVGVSYELAVRKTGDSAYRAAVGVALAGVFLLIWVNGAVGIIGSEDNNANLMYWGVLAVGFIGALVARFEPQGMARALVATSASQTLVAGIALVAESDSTKDIVIATAFFAALWLGSAGLFRKSAAGKTDRAGRTPNASSVG